MGQIDKSRMHEVTFKTHRARAYLAQTCILDDFKATYLFFHAFLSVCILTQECMKVVYTRRDAFLLRFKNANTWWIREGA